VTNLDDRTAPEPGWVARAVDRLRGWPYGPVRVVNVVRIGAEHGLSGTVYRVTVDCADRQRRTFVLKQDGAPGIERALAFHAAMGDRLIGSVPACYGGEIDDSGGIGFLFLEDIAPAVQGDVLVDPGDEAAGAAMRTIARVHATSWRSSGADHPASLLRWHAEAWAPDRWSERLTGARTRYPEILTAEVSRSLKRLPDQVDDAITELRAGPASWIHGDAHLDNIVWRADGSAVLLDWAGAVIGPPAVDAARFLVEGPTGLAADPERRMRLIGAYSRELTERGVPSSDVAAIPTSVGQAMLPLVQGIVGWAGRPEEEPIGRRMAALRENALRSVVGWLSRTS